METSQVRGFKQSTAALLVVGVLTFESVSAARVLIVSLVPRANGDYSAVTGVSAGIVMLYP
jgi:hypothetical protein